MRLQSLIEVVGAYTGIDDGKHDQYDGDNGEARQILPHGQIESLVAGLIHSCELEDEVGQTTEEQEDGEDHSRLILAPCPKGGEEEDQNGDGDGSHGQPLFDIGEPRDDDEELHRKS